MKARKHARPRTHRRLNKTWPEGIFANRQKRVQARNHYPRANGTSPDWSRVQAARAGIRSTAPRWPHPRRPRSQQADQTRQLWLGKNRKLFLPLKNGRRRPLSRRHHRYDRWRLEIGPRRSVPERFSNLTRSRRKLFRSTADSQQLASAYRSIPLTRRVSFREMRDPSLRDWPPLHKCSARTPGFQHGVKLRGAHRRTSARSRAASSDRAHPPVESAALHRPVVQGPCRSRKPGPPRLRPLATNPDCCIHESKLQTR